jgi:nucleotide-binding universal stress UspA family protein
MSRKKILYATDFSPISMAAFETAQSLARSEDALLLIVHVAAPPYLGDGEIVYQLAADERASLERSLADIRPADPMLEYKHRLLAGNPAKEIVRLAGEEAVDLIVIGAHGRTGLARVLMGSVAEVVVRRAPCPVLAYKQPQPRAGSVTCCPDASAPTVGEDKSNNLSKRQTAPGHREARPGTATKASRPQHQAVES